MLQANNEEIYKMYRFCKSPWKTILFAFLCVLALSGCEDILSALESDPVRAGSPKLTITEVSVLPLNGLTASPGTERYFVATVRMSDGSVNAAGVTWTLTGNKDPVTRMIGPGAPAVTGILVIGPNESAEKLAVTAVSRADESKTSDPVEVTVIRTR
jgi:hypothetical protein